MGWCIFLGGAAIWWKTNPMKGSQTSTAEAEYSAPNECGKDILLIRELFLELGWEITEPTLIQIDNDAANRMASSYYSHNKTRHIASRKMFINEYVEELRSIILEHIDSALNASDHFTKRLTGEAFLRHVEIIMGILNNPQYGLSRALTFLRT